MLRKACVLLAVAGLSATALSAPDATVEANLVEQAVKIRDDSKLHLRDVVRLQELARKQKDSIKLNCVNEMLVQMKPHMNLLETAESSLATSSEPTTAFESVQGAGNSIRLLAEQAAQCVGEPEMADETSNSYTAPDVPDDPFTGQDGLAGPHDIEPPGYASADR